MEKSKKIILLFLIAFTCYGCQNIIDSITGTSSTNTEAMTALNKAQQIQEIYWKCFGDPLNINSNKLIWEKSYNKDIVDAGIELYLSTFMKDAEVIEVISGQSISQWTPEQKAALIEAIEKIKTQK